MSSISAKIFEEILKCETKLHEWVFRNENNEVLYVPKKHRKSVSDSNTYSNGVVFAAPVEAINIDKVIELIGGTYPEKAHDIIILVNNIALDLDNRDFR